MAGLCHGRDKVSFYTSRSVHVRLIDLQDTPIKCTERKGRDRDEEVDRGPAVALYLSRTDNDKGAHITNGLFHRLNDSLSV